MMDISWALTYTTESGEKRMEGREVFSSTLTIRKNLGDAVIEKVEATIDLDYGKDAGFFLNGYQTWTYSPEYRMDSRERGLHGIPSFIKNKYNLSGYGDYSFVEYPNKKGLLHGFSYMTIREGDNFTLLASLDERPGWTIFHLDAERKVLTLTRDAKGQKVNGEYDAFSLFLAKGTEEEVYSAWFHALGLTTVARPLAGYSSWYNRYQDISEETIREDLKGAKEILRKGDLFQIDDGWEIAVGQWEHDERKFPKGLKPLVDEIHDSGFLAGLWLAPFVAEENSSLFKEHKSWLLSRDGEGYKCGCNWSGFWALDIDDKEVIDYLRKTFDKVFNEWGFDLVKLDFLYGAAPFPKKGENRADRMIRAMEMLRELCKDKLILGCGVPVMAGFGLTDYSRVSCDVTLDWDDKPWMKIIHSERPSTKRAIETSFNRRMLNRGAFITDPDVFFLRKENIHLSKERKKLLATFAALNKGLFLTSDNPSLYGEEERKEYERIRDIWENAEDIEVERGERTIIHYSLHSKKETLILPF